MLRIDFDEDVAALYGNQLSTGTSSGYDLYLPEDTVFPAGKVTFVNFKVKATTTFGHGYFLLPRSSLSKTPLRLANSIGLIDPDYRGNLIAALDNPSNNDYEVKRGTRLVQIALGSLCPFAIEVGTLDNTARGDGGFGSTGSSSRYSDNGVNYIR